MAGAIDSDVFGSLTDSDLWMDGAAVLAGFAIPSIAHQMGEQMVPFNAPDEAYGAATIVLAEMVPVGGYKRNMQVGAAVNSLYNAAQRTSLGNQLPNVGSGA